jgi:hypothetical protein
VKTATSLKPSGVITFTLTLPAECPGAVATISLSLTTRNFALLEPKYTMSAKTSPWPEMTAAVPPTPLLGEILLIQPAAAW